MSRGIWPPRGPFGHGGRPSHPSAVAPLVALWQAWATPGSSLDNEIPAIFLRHRNPVCRPVQREQLRLVLGLLQEADLRARSGDSPVVDGARWAHAAVIYGVPEGGMLF